MLTVCTLKMQRDGIVQPRPYPPVAKVLLKLVTSVGENYEKMVDVMCIGSLYRDSNLGDRRQLLTICCRYTATILVPCI
jgi:hypothetical protein